ncbi:MFS transporter [Dellaglioa algida]|uniref:Sodium:solute symporter n=1 Tax=Dellaglioa algida TaxID=105612 RepID=A0A5C6MGD0_9LACO|nr:MFS transporter [Dellaglioa algida]MDK1716091.1 MFS transporter [Dellaglioa algida]MDK1719372.1 MFS transporter [Dellaglioa algida]MDK1721126.1 MFS transporter [Dellaglioa algida]MDK1722715.1 MFS transporter [Dellaglioa algida]MDK1724334.1 MFS transporter [Dellaglioa algida]
MTNSEEEDTTKLSLLERFSYGQLDAAGQLVFCVISSYLLYFYTDVVGIPVAAAGVILLVARVFDGIDAPIWGSLIDMTHSKYGRVRPYLLWLIVPFTISAIFMFWTPNLSTNVMIWYCGITYVITGILYTGLNTPLTAILPLLTRDIDERVVLNSWRMTGSQTAVLFVNAFTLPLVAFLGQGNDKFGFRYLMVIFATLGLIMTIFSFYHLKERVEVPRQKVNFRKGLSALRGNWPWIIVFISNFFWWVANTERSTTLVYFFTYYVGNKLLVSVFNAVGIVQLLGMISVPFLIKRFTRQQIWIASLLMAILGQVIMMLAGKTVGILMVGWIIGNIGSGTALSLVFVAIGTAVDYGTWKTGITSAGLLTALGTSFCLKVGSGIAGFVPSAIMSKFGYVANQTQSAHSLLGISISFNVVTIIAFTLALLPIFFYKKYESMEKMISQTINK